MWQSHMYIHEWRPSPHPEVMRKYEAARLDAVAANMPDSPAREHARLLAQDLWTRNLVEIGQRIEIAMTGERNRLYYQDQIELTLGPSRACQYHERKAKSIFGDLFDAKLIGGE